MTISSTDNHKQWPGDDVQVSFPFDKVVLKIADLKVILINDTTFEETEQTIPAHFTVSGNQDDVGGYPNGLTITMNVAPATGETLHAYLDPEMLQEYDHKENEGFLAEPLERVYDRLTLITQRQRNMLDRTLRISLGADPDTILSMPLRDPGKALVWDLTEKKLVNSQDVFDNIVTLAEAAQAAAETAETNAANSESNAANSETNAAASAASIDIHTTTVNEFEKLNHYGPTTAPATTGAIEWDIENNPLMTANITGNITISIKAGMPDGAIGMFRIYQGSTSGYTISYSANGYDMRFDQEVVPELGNAQYSELLLIAFVLYSRVTFTAFTESKA